MSEEKLGQIGGKNIFVEIDENRYGKKAMEDIGLKEHGLLVM